MASSAVCLFVLVTSPMLMTGPEPSTGVYMWPSRRPLRGEPRLDPVGRQATPAEVVVLEVSVGFPKPSDRSSREASGRRG